MAEEERVETKTPEIPDRLFFRIGDVSDLTGVETYVLRFWEGEFPTLSPKKASNGQRQYRRKDVQKVLEIKRLLWDEEYTIPGARKALKERAKKKRTTPPKPRQASLLEPELTVDAQALADIKKELREILALLKK
jgi:DNA-binding transcriptional MerR regulator